MKLALTLCAVALTACAVTLTLWVTVLDRSIAIEINGMPAVDSSVSLCPPPGQLGGPNFCR
jgi:hypothetical protein